MTDPRELEPDPPDYEPEMDDDWTALIEGWPPDGQFSQEDVFSDGV